MASNPVTLLIGKDNVADYFSKKGFIRQIYKLKTVPKQLTVSLVYTAGNALPSFCFEIYGPGENSNRKSISVKTVLSWEIMKFFRECSTAHAEDRFEYWIVYGGQHVSGYPKPDTWNEYTYCSFEDAPDAINRLSAIQYYYSNASRHIRIIRAFDEKWNAESYEEIEKFNGLELHYLPRKNGESTNKPWRFSMGNMIYLGPGRINPDNNSPREAFLGISPQISFVLSNNDFYKLVRVISETQELWDQNRYEYVKY
jgi:hypothetical protein